ncbi:Doublecortin family protein [Aphelenchoides fujianensis]|nr:Doublecortin family protein [Aphelenchoides fujianensis]
MNAPHPFDYPAYRYVASSTRRGKGLDMDTLEKRKREREAAFRYRNPTSIDRATTEWGVYFVLNGRPSHIYRAVLNPARPLDLESVLEEVSQGLEVAIFRIYTYEGERITGVQQLLELKDNRVLAVPRHERLMLHGRAYADAEQPQPSAPPAGLPPIRRWRDSSRSSSNQFDARAARRWPQQTQSNSIERPRKAFLPPTAATLPQAANRQRYVSSLLAGKMKASLDETMMPSNQAASSSFVAATERKAPNFPRIQNVEATTTIATVKTTQWRAKRAARDGGRKRPIAPSKSWNATHTISGAAAIAATSSGVVANTLQSSTNTADSDSGRPRSSNDFSNGHTTAVPPDEFDEEIEEEDEESDEADGDAEDEMEPPRIEMDGVEADEEDDDDDYPQQPAGVMTQEELEAEEEEQRQRRAAVENDDEDDRAAANLLALREEREDREVHTIKPGSASDNEARIHSAINAATAAARYMAAAKIQAGARGFLARQRMKKRRTNPQEELRRTKSLDEDEAATKIQAGARGFLTRRRIKRDTNRPQSADIERPPSAAEEKEDDDQASVHSRASAAHSATSRRSAASHHSAASGQSRRSEPEPKGEVERDVEEEMNEEESAHVHFAPQAEVIDGSVVQTKEVPKPEEDEQIEVEANEAQADEHVLTTHAEIERLPTGEQPEEAEALRLDLPPPSNDPESSFYSRESEAEEPEPEPKAPPTVTLIRNDTEPDHDVCSGSDEDEDDVLAKRTQGPEKVDSYTVTVKMGNRWAADSETELYVTLIGDRKESEKFYMRQKYVNWLESEEKHYGQEGSDTFSMQVDCEFLGVVRKLIVGHDSVGYGAGIFIDRIVVTEDAVNGRAFLFQCLKWFDSGQVDGKLERTLRLSAYYDMEPIPHAMQRVTHSRWEVILHNGDSKGQGGTTSNLRLVGFGTRGSNSVELANEKELREVPSKTLMQCHFNGIGELLKLRIEIDGEGEQPDYFLDQVELRDLDTQHRCVVPCGKWLRWGSTKKGDQPFREVLTFAWAPSLITYDGKMRITPPKFECIEPLIRVELEGDIGSTGAVWVDLGDAVEKGGKIDLSFKVEAVSIGKLEVARLYMQPNDIGEQIYEGFAILQEIWNAHDAESNRLTPLGTTGNDWLVGFLYVREGSHTPYRYVLNTSCIRPRSSPDEPYVKELRRSALEGSSTRLSKKKSAQPKSPSWLLSMSLDAESRLLPLIFLCGMKDTAEMNAISNTPTDNLLSYRLKGADLGELCKVRVKTERRALLGPQSTKETNGKAEEAAVASSSDQMVHIKKMRLSDTANGDEIRFPAANTRMVPEQIFEFPVFWPDRPPLQNLIYEAHVQTGASNLTPDAAIWLNLFGEFGDISYRKLTTFFEDRQPEKPLYSEDSRVVFEFEAVSIGELTTAEITVECDRTEFLWECAELRIEADQGQQFVFHFNRPFTAQNNRQNASVHSSYFSSK